MSDFEAVAKDLEAVRLEAKEEEELAFDPTMKKKKKKAKKIVSTEAEEAEQDEQEIESQEQVEKADEADEVDGEGEDLDEFDPSKMKKKKRPKKKVTFSDDETTGGVEGEEGVDSEKKLGTEEGENAENDEGNEEEEEIDEDAPDPWLGSDRDYTYQELLGRVVKILRQRNPELSGDRRRYTIAPPQVVRDGKKSVFVNIPDICKRMNRPMEHLIQFLFTELGTTGSVDGNDRLIIKGRFQQKNMEHMLRRYIREYVTCKTCKSPETTITKENRLFFMQCESCGSTRSVATIKSGFVAQTTKRSVLRRAAGQ